MPAGGGADLGRSHRNQLMQLSLALPLSLRDFFKPRHFTAQVLHLAGRPVSYESKNERYFLQSWVAAEQEKWIELGLKRVGVDDLKVTFPVIDLCPRAGMQLHQVQTTEIRNPTVCTRRICVRAYSLGINRFKAFIEGDLQFGIDNFLGIDVMIVFEALEDRSSIRAPALHQFVEELEVPSAPGFNQVGEVRREDRLDFADPRRRRTAGRNVLSRLLPTPTA